MPVKRYRTALLSGVAAAFVLVAVAPAFAQNSVSVNTALARQGVRISLWFKGEYYDQVNERMKVGGLSLYWPRKKQYPKERPFYSLLPFARATHWDEFLDHRMLE